MTIFSDGLSVEQSCAPISDIHAYRWMLIAIRKDRSMKAFQIHRFFERASFNGSRFDVAGLDVE